MNRIRSAVSLALVGLALSGCSSSPTSKAATPPPPPAACEKLPDPVLPHSAGMLTEQQAGVYCLPRGQRVDVFLTEASKSAAWQPVQASGDGVLAPTASTMMTAPQGVTPAMFLGATDGTAVLTSATPAGGSWKVTIVVKG